MDLARKNVVEDWIQNYPGIVANGHVPDSTDNLISKYFDAIVALAEQTHPEEYSKGGTESFLKTTGFRFVASELQTLKDSYFSKIEYFTAFPYWWGDFLNRCLKSINPHLFRTFMSRMDILFARAILLKQLDLKDVYCIQDGIPILLLEQECTNWAYELLKIDPVLEQDQKNPLIPFFRFHPEKFVPSTLAMVKLRREMSKMPNSRAKTPNLEWFKPIMALPALFTYSKPCAQNFDKRILLLRVSFLTTPSSPSFLPHPSFPSSLRGYDVFLLPHPHFFWFNLWFRCGIY